MSDQTVGNVLKRHGIPPAPEQRHSRTNVPFGKDQPLLESELLGPVQILVGE